MYKIKFIDANKRLDNELKSKLLDPNSELYKELSKIRNLLIEKFEDVKIEPQRMDFHIELIPLVEMSLDDEYNKNLLITRARELEDTEIDLNICYSSKTVKVDVLKKHITIAYIPGGIPDDMKDFLLNL
jgi:hypothetical protein